MGRKQTYRAHRAETLEETLGAAACRRLDNDLMDGLVIRVELARRFGLAIGVVTARAALIGAPLANNIVMGRADPGRRPGAANAAGAWLR